MRIQNELEPSHVTSLALGIEKAAVAAGLGRTTICEAIAAGDLPSLLIGRRRLVLVEDLRAWLKCKAVGMPSEVGEPAEPNDIPDSDGRRTRP